MKRITYIVALVLTNLFLLTSCERENFSYGNSEESGKDAVAEGTVHLASVKLSVVLNDVKVITRDGDTEGNKVDVSNFIVKIYSESGKEVAKWTYSEMPEIFSLEVGKYTIEASSYENEEAAVFSKPYYFGQQSFQIYKDNVTEVATLTCKMKSIMVTIEYDDELKKMLEANKDAIATVTLGTASLQFGYGSSLAGYFQAVSENSNILRVNLTGTVDGVQINYDESFTGVKQGEHRVIRFTVKKVEVDAGETGSATFKIEIDASCTTEEVTVDLNDANGSEGTVPDFPEEKPGNGDSNGEENGEGNEGGNENSEDMPTIVGRGFDIVNDILYTVGDNAVTSVIVDITAPKGISNLNVTIDSPTLTADVLTSVGLEPSFDLAHPATAKLSTGLAGLGFPVGDQVIGQQSVTFDISQFLILLGVYGSAEHHFIIQVIDQDGNSVTRTLKLQS